MVSDFTELRQTGGDFRKLYVSLNERGGVSFYMGGSVISKNGGGDFLWSLL